LTVGASERGEDVECPGLEVVAREDEAALTVEVASETRNTREHLERRDVDTRKHPAPSANQSLDFVLHPNILTSRYLRD
jgi:hypothetical protein